MQAALRAVGVPAVVGGTESVFGSPSADRLAAAARSPRTAGVPAACGRRRPDPVRRHDRRRRGRRRRDDLGRPARPPPSLGRRPAPARASPPLTRSIMATEGLPARILAESDRRTRLTDLGHIAELLHAEASDRPARSARPAGLVRPAGSRSPAVETADAEDRSRRLDSDADAVQVLTIHRAKGLEFPVVYCPYLWDSGLDAAERPARRCTTTPTPPPTGGRWTSVWPTRTRTTRITSGRPRRAAGRGPPAPLRRRSPGPATRSWSGGSAPTSPQHSPLGRLLMCPRPGRQRAGQRGLRSPTTPTCRPGSRSWPPGSRSHQRRALRPPSGRPPGGTGRPPFPVELAAARFDRDLDRAWRRTSYSGITAAAHERRRRQRARDPGITDEPDERRRHPAPAILAHPADPGAGTGRRAGTGVGRGRSGGRHRAGVAAGTGAGTRGPSRGRACGPSHLPSGRHSRAAPRSAPSSTPCWSESTSPRPTSPPRSPRPLRARAGPPRHRHRLARAGRRPGWWPPSPPRSDRSSTDGPCATSPGRPPRRAPVRAAPRRRRPSDGRGPDRRHRQAVRRPRYHRRATPSTATRARLDQPGAGHPPARLPDRQPRPGPADP